MCFLRDQSALNWSLPEALSVHKHFRADWERSKTNRFPSIACWWMRGTAREQHDQQWQLQHDASHTLLLLKNGALLLLDLICQVLERLGYSRIGRLAKRARIGVVADNTSQKAK